MITFTYKNTDPSDSKWVALHNGIFYYLYDDKNITLVQYCQQYDKRKEFECTDIYDALIKISRLTQQTPVFQSSDDMMDVSSNYLA